MIARRDRELVQELLEASKEVQGTWHEIKWIMGNVTRMMKEMMADMNYRMRFHSFQGLRVVSRAIAYGFIQVNGFRE